jgi:hypothetical protein
MPRIPIDALPVVDFDQTATVTSRLAHGDHSLNGLGRPRKIRRFVASGVDTIRVAIHMGRKDPPNREDRSTSARAHRFAIVRKAGSLRLEINRA